MKKYSYLLAVLFASASLSLHSCSEEDLDPTLSQDKDIESGVSTLGDLNALIIGMYNRVSLSDYYGRDIIIFSEVRSDNTFSNANSNRFVNVAEMDLTIESGDANRAWSGMYRVIGSANIIINAEGVSGDQEAVNHLKGQALAIRALAHFDLVKLFGQQNVNGGSESSLGVPYVTTFREAEGLFPARNTVAEVKQFAYDDLDDALDLLSSSLDDQGREFITTDAAKAIYARIALYFGDYELARDYSKEVIDSNNFSILGAGDFVGSFDVDSSSNSIFEIAASDVDNNGINGLANIYQDTNYGDVVVLEDLVNIYGPTDVRGLRVLDDPATTDIDESKAGIISTDAAGRFRNSGKYPSTGVFEDNIPVIRYEEMVLIYAEALYEINNADPMALTFLNSIPQNRNADVYTVVNRDNILLERRKELAFEGFRFDDLARTGRNIPLVNAVQQTHGGPVFGSFKFAFPIPAAEIQANSNVVQNFGY